jgi:NADH-quinone oxidoreductase subunit E
MSVLAAEYDVEQAIDEILQRYEAKPTALIMILQDIQKHYRYLMRDALELVSRRMELPLAQIYGVATFYKAFSLTPKGRHHVCVCTGTACHVRGARVIIDKLETELGIRPGQTSSDMEYSIETVNCLGACALGPLVTFDEEFHGNMTGPKVDRMLRRQRRADDATVGEEESA